MTRAGARDLLAELLPIRERVQGAEHPETLTTRHNHAYWKPLGRAWRPSFIAERSPVRSSIAHKIHNSAGSCRSSRRGQPGRNRAPEPLSGAYGILVPELKGDESVLEELNSMLKPELRGLVPVG